MALQSQQEFLAQLDFKLPEEYRIYLFAADSEYQFAGAYLVEYHELLLYNTDYKANAFYPGYFLIGSSGGGEAFAIEKATGYFVMIPFINHDAESVIVIGQTWSEFQERLLSDDIYD